MSLFERLKNILTGKDLNFDGKVDIRDKFISAERKAQASKPAKERK
tara:strand:- start:19 stop:156 length:138 start_codon:yes stop_codon:yes gene_type:complete